MYIRVQWLKNIKRHSYLLLIHSIFFFFKKFIDFRETEEGEGRGRKREGDVNLLFHLFMHSLVDSCMCPDWELNPQP